MPPTEANVNLGYSGLAAVLIHISIASMPTTRELKDVSRSKLKANHLSQDVADFLKVGMRRTPIVKQFFDIGKPPAYGEKIALAFKNQYRALRDATPKLHPDKIFEQLQAWATGTQDTTPMHKAAVLAVMA